MLNKTKKKLDFSITVLIVIGILIVVNFFSYQLFYRLDITQNKDYSISKVSKNAVKNLDEIVSIKAYFSKNLPSRYITVRQEVEDILNEYKNYSNGKISVEFIDPTSDDQATEQEMYMKGIPPLQFNVLEKDKYQVVKGYMGMTIGYGDKIEAIPVVQDTANLEYQLTTAIKKVTVSEIGQIGYATSNGTLDRDEAVSTAYQKLQELYSVQDVDLSSGDISKDIDTLIIAGPKDSFKDDELKMINKFVMGGGKLLVLLDMVNIDQGLTASPNATNINNLLEKYGLKVNKDLVLDTRSGMASFSQGFFSFSVNYPFWPKVEKDGFDQENAAVSNLESAVFPWVSSVEVVNDKLAENSKVAFLVRTTPKAWKITDNFNISPQQDAIKPTGETKQLVLAAMLTGTVNSAYPDKDEKTPESASDARIIVVGDSDFVSDNFVKNTSDNLILFQNLVDSLSLDSDLINIRSKGVTSRPIQSELSESAKAVIRYGNIFGITVIVIAIGMARYYARRKRKFVEEL